MKTRITIISIIAVAILGISIFILNPYHYPKGYNPVQITSVKIIPNNPHVNDAIDFNATFQNLGYPPIYYIGGCGPVLTYSILSNNTETISVAPCMCPIEPTTKPLSHNEIAYAITSFCTSDRQFVTKSGQYLANVTVHWSIEPSMYLANSTSTLIKLNILK